MSAKSFIRDSIEYRPITEFDEDTSEELRSEAVYDEPQPIVPVDYSAYEIPTAYDTENPQPFRFGSPFQQIVDASSVDQISPEILKKFEAEENAERLGELRKGATDTDYKVLCFVTNWSFYRKDDAKFAPEHIDKNLCTHIIYSFASLDPERLLIKEFDPWADVENDLYRRTVALGVPVLLAVGGWTDSTGDKYSKLVSNPSARRTFITNVVPFLKNYGFSGLYFDWNYPKCWQSNCKKGPTSDRPNFTKFLQELSAEFKRQRPTMQLGVGISGYKEIITEAYELAPISKAVDFMAAMTYDYHGSWEEQTGHVSPLYGRPSDKYPQYNTDFAMQLLVKNGAARDKLIMGVPFYGQSFQLQRVYTSLVGEGTPASGPGTPGEFTRQPGMLSYYEICGLVRKQKWRIGRDGSGKSGPYAMNHDQWVGYDDAESVANKAKYVMKSGFGGIAAWTIDLDDFVNTCCLEAFPLLRSINRVFGRVRGEMPSLGTCMRPPAPVTPAPPMMTTISENGQPGQHEHTTWPQWKPQQSTTTSTTELPIDTEPETTKKTTISWWQTSSEKPVTWWSKPSTTTKRPTTEPTTVTSWWSTTSTSTRRPQTTTTTEVSVIPGPINTMPVVIDGETCQVGEYRANPYDCNEYYRCVYGQLTLQHCAGGLHWNQNGLLCDWPARAMCTVQPMPEADTMPATTTVRRPMTPQRVTTQRTSTTRRRTTAKPRPSTTPRRPSMSSQDITTCQTGDYQPHKDCNLFYICVNNVLIPQHCGPGLQWSQEQKGCNRAEVVRCVSETKYLKLINGKASEDDLCEGNTQYPYPGKCNQYLLCNHGQLMAADCAEGLHWNQNMKICDWPASAMCMEEGSGGGSSPSVGGGGSEIDALNEVVPSKRPPLTRPPTTERPGPTTTPIPLTPNSGHYKLVCYFTNWAWYRKGLAKYTPDNIDVNLCTHVVYGFAILDYSELTLRVYDSWADIDNKFYERVAALQSKGVKVSVALGGWNDSQGDKYSRLVRSAAARSKFVQQAVQFIEKYGFGGLDLDWEYPVCWQTECTKGHPDEKEGFTSLVRELSQAFKPKGYLLSSAVSPSKQIIDTGYDVPELAKHFDWIAVMTYDFHGQWDKKTGHVAPLYYYPGDEFSYFNAVSRVGGYVCVLHNFLSH